MSLKVLYINFNVCWVTMEDLATFECICAQQCPQNTRDYIKTKITAICAVNDTQNRNTMVITSRLLTAGKKFSIIRQQQWSSQGIHFIFHFSSFFLKPTRIVIFEPPLPDKCTPFFHHRYPYIQFNPLFMVKFV